jgi:hypothetical protein
MTVKKITPKTYYMKKLLFLMIVLLISGAMQAQGSTEKTVTKSFLVLHAGPSFPIGDFGKTNLIDNGTNLIYNGEAGFAKTGFNVNINYGYQFVKNLGLAASVFYNNNKLNNKAFVDQLNGVVGEEVIDATGLKLDHWKWYGLTVGPMINHELTKDLTIDLRVMGGVANVNSPKATFEGFEVAKEDWAIAPVFQTGLDMRIGVGKNMFIYTGVDYLYMKPKFTLEYTIDQEMTTETAKQKMSVLNVTGGFGIRF